MDAEAFKAMVVNAEKSFAERVREAEAQQKSRFGETVAELSQDSQAGYGPSTRLNSMVPEPRARRTM
jgi:hypothetical protein